MAKREGSTAPPELQRLHEVQSRLTQARGDLRTSTASLHTEQKKVERARAQVAERDTKLGELQAELQERDDDGKAAAEQLAALAAQLQSRDAGSDGDAVRIAKLEADLQQARKSTAAAVSHSADAAEQAAALSRVAREEGAARALAEVEALKAAHARELQDAVREAERKASRANAGAAADAAAGAYEETLGEMTRLKRSLSDELEGTIEESRAATEELAGLRQELQARDDRFTALEEELRQAQANAQELEKVARLAEKSTAAAVSRATERAAADAQALEETAQLQASHADKLRRLREAHIEELRLLREEHTEQLRRAAFEAAEAAREDTAAAVSHAGQLAMTEVLAGHAATIAALEEAHAEELRRALLPEPEPEPEGLQLVLPGSGYPAKPGDDGVTSPQVRTQLEVLEQLHRDGLLAPEFWKAAQRAVLGETISSALNSDGASKDVTQALMGCLRVAGGLRDEVTALRSAVVVLQSDLASLLPRAARRLVKKIQMLQIPLAVAATPGPPPVCPPSPERPLPVYSVEFRTTMLGLRKAVQNGNRTLFGKRITDGRSLFLAIDRQCDGLVSRSELADALKRLGLASNETRAEALMEEVPLERHSRRDPRRNSESVESVDWPEFLRVSKLDGPKSPPTRAEQATGRTGTGFPPKQDRAEQGRRARMQQLALEDQMDQGAGWQYNSFGRSDEQSGDSAQPSGTLAMPEAEVRLTAFKAADVNGNTWLSLHEVNAAALQIWPALTPRHRVNTAVVVHAYHAADENDDGKIGRREFRLFCVYVVYFSRWWSTLESVGTVRFRESGTPTSMVVDATGFEEGCAALGVPHSAAQFLELMSGSAAASQAAGAPVGEQVVPLDVFATWCARLRGAPHLLVPSPAGQTPQSADGSQSVAGPQSSLKLREAAIARREAALEAPDIPLIGQREGQSLRRAAWPSPEASEATSSPLARSGGRGHRSRPGLGISVGAPSPLRDGERRSR